ncbi:hypothetical protein BH09VER1_BH09VER1_25330 [soil metagenome]
MRRPDFRTLYDAVAIALGTLVLGVVFWRLANMDPMWAIVAFILVYDPDPRAAYGSGLARMFHTLLGCSISVGAIFLMGLHWWLLPLTLGVTALGSGYVVQFRGARRTLLVCEALVIGTTLSEPGGEVPLAITRAIEVAGGSTLAVLLSWPLGYLIKEREKQP